jgi:hypothetical protein
MVSLFALREPVAANHAHRSLMVSLSNHEAGSPTGSPSSLDRLRMRAVEEESPLMRDGLQPPP